MDDFEAEKAKSLKGPSCSVQEAYSVLQKPDADELRDALVRPEISAAVISRVLARHGVKVGGQTIARHRRGDCSCERV